MAARMGGRPGKRQQRRPAGMAAGGHGRYGVPPGIRSIPPAPIIAGPLGMIRSTAGARADRRHGGGNFSRASSIAFARSMVEIGLLSFFSSITAKQSWIGVEVCDQVLLCLLPGDCLQSVAAHFARASATSASPIGTTL